MLDLCLLGWESALRHAIDGETVLLGRDGCINADMLKRCHVDEDEIGQALREADLELFQVRSIYLEADGRITVLGHAAPKVSGEQGHQRIGFAAAGRTSGSEQLALA